MNDDLISRSLAVEAIENIRRLIWDVDIPSPTVPEYVEHHEQMQMLMRKCDAWLSIIEREHAAQPEQRWIPVSKRQPDEPGVYLATVFNREWVGDDIRQGAKPPKDEYWDDHKNIFAERQDGKWVVTCQRVFDGKCWTGYGEIQLAWMEMPAPYTEEDNG